MAKEHQISVRGVSSAAKKDLVTIARYRHTSINGEVLLAIEQYIAEWRKSTPQWFSKKKTVLQFGSEEYELK